jgi:DNA polymerase III alpha subunit
MRLRQARLTWTAAEALVLAGAFDGLRPTLERRQRLWQLHELWPLISPVGGRGSRYGRHPAAAQRGEVSIEQLPLSWEIAAAESDTVPRLPGLDREERVALDYQLLGLSARRHPMSLLRRELRQQGVCTIADLAETPAGQIVHVAGWAISAQRPPTAKGMGFIVLEDETGRLPVAFPPRLAAQLYRILRDARVVEIAGRVERMRWYRSLLAFEIERVVPRRGAAARVAEG